MKLSTIIASILTAISIGILYYLILPALSLKAGSFYTFLLWAFIFLIAIFGMCYRIADDHDEEVLTGITIASIIAVIAIRLIITIANAPIVTSRTLQSIPEVKDGNFIEDYPDISSDPANAFTLDLDSAKRLGSRAIGNIENASWYEVNNEFNLITYNGVKYRLSPLEYGGLFKYNKGKNNGIPGYVLVNDDTLEATFVKTDKPIVYSPSAYFGKDLYRHLRRQYRSLIFTDSIFEIDEEGNPYWVTGVTYPHAALYSGQIVEKVILTEPYSGDSTLYDLSDVPEWIDHVYGLDYLMNRVFWHYSYVKGFWNTQFSKTGIYRTSYEYRDKKDNREDNTANFYGYNSFVNKNGETVFVTGITPANNSESNIGFITANARTGEFIFYPAEGAEESSAQEACESIMQNYGYKATYPVFVNVNGQPTYMMALKDKAGIIQAYGFVNLKNYSIASVDKDINVAISIYKQSVGMDTDYVPVETDDVKVSEGFISEIYSQEIGGTTYYYYVVEGQIYKASAGVNELQFLFKVGDKVEFKYQDISDVINVISIEKIDKTE